MHKINERTDFVSRERTMQCSPEEFDSTIFTHATQNLILDKLLWNCKTEEDKEYRNLTNEYLHLCFEPVCCNHQCKEFPIGSVAYYINSDNNVDFGIVSEHFYGQTILQKYELKAVAKINGTPTFEMNFPTEWQPVPKHDDALTVEVDYKLDERGKEIFINSPQSIIQGIKSGILVMPYQNDNYSYIYEFSEDKAKHKKEELIPKKSYRIIRDIHVRNHRSNIAILRFGDFFHTYEQAKLTLEQQEREKERIKNLSDYDYAIYQIETAINKWEKLYGIFINDLQKYKNYLLSLKNIEEVEVRVYDQHIQWKYAKNKEWTYTNPNDLKYVDIEKLLGFEEASQME